MKSKNVKLAEQDVKGSSLSGQVVALSFANNSMFWYCVYLSILVPLDGQPVADCMV